MKERDLRIDLAKIIATAMVVILHVVENTGGGYAQQCLYLLGTFGIPLFLTVNGYLMWDREISPSYLKKKFVRYFRFILLWSVIVGAAESVMERRLAFFDVFVGAWLGKGRLYHLWFITTILLILGLDCLFSRISRQHEVRRRLLSTKWMITLVILMNALFIINTFFFYTGDVVIAPFRLLTNGGFYLLGMYLHSRNITLKTRNLIAVSIAGYVAICVLSVTLSIKWASAMYASIFCVAGVLSITVFCLQLKVTDHPFWRIVHFVAPASIGIWVTHPFAVAVGRKILEYVGFEIDLPIRVFMVPAIFLLCLFGVKIALKIKGIRMWFQI